MRVVSGSSAALDQWQSWPPDVVILDMAISAHEQSLLEHPVVQASGIPVIAVPSRIGLETIGAQT